MNIMFVYASRSKEQNVRIIFLQGVHIISSMKHRLKEIRDQHRLSQTAMGEIMGLTLRGYQYLEKGERKLSTDHIKKAAQALGIPESDFFQETVKMNVSSMRGLGEIQADVWTESDPARELLSRLIEKTDVDMKFLSEEVLGKNHAYIQQFLMKGSPRELSEDARERLANYFGCSPDEFRVRATESVQATPKPLNGRPPITISEVDVRAAGGGGQLVENDGRHVVGSWVIPRQSADWMSSSNGNLRVIEVVGISMSPELLPGDRVVVDLSDKTPSPPGLFVVWDGLGLVVKHVHHVPNSDPPRIILSSVNKQYPDYEVSLEECHINGRVISKWQRT